MAREITMLLPHSVRWNEQLFF